MNRRVILGGGVSLSLMLSVGCTWLSVHRVDPGDSGGGGMRYYLPKPFLQVVPKDTGELTVEVVTLPDQTEEFAVESGSLLSSHTLSVETTRGLLASVTWKPTATTVASGTLQAVGGAIENVTKAKETAASNKETDVAAAAALVDAKQLEIAKLQLDIDADTAKLPDATAQAKLDADTLALKKDELDLQDLQGKLQAAKNKSYSSSVDAISVTASPSQVNIGSAAGAAQALYTGTTYALGGGPVARTVPGARLLEVDERSIDGKPAVVLRDVDSEQSSMGVNSFVAYQPTLELLPRGTASVQYRPTGTTEVSWKPSHDIIGLTGDPASITSAKLPITVTEKAAVTLKSDGTIAVSFPALAPGSYIVGVSVRAIDERGAYQNAVPLHSGVEVLAPEPVKTVGGLSPVVAVAANGKRVANVRTTGWPTGVHIQGIDVRYLSQGNSVHVTSGASLVSSILRDDNNSMDVDVTALPLGLYSLRVDLSGGQKEPATWSATVECDIATGSASERQLPSLLPIGVVGLPKATDGHQSCIYHVSREVELVQKGPTVELLDDKGRPAPSSVGASASLANGQELTLSLSQPAAGRYRVTIPVLYRDIDATATPGEGMIVQKQADLVASVEVAK